MRPTVIANSNASAAAGSPTTNSNGVNIPINHEYAGHPPQQQHPHHQQQQPYTQYSDANPTAFGSPRQQQPHTQQQQQQPIPAHFQQGFGFEPDMDIDMDMDMFPRSRLGRMHHDPFTSFGGTHFDFPQFGSIGRRRAGADPMANDRDFFNRLPSEFRQYIPETFGHRRAGGGGSAPMQQQQQPPSAQQQQQHPPPQQQYYQNYVQPGNTPPPNGMQQPQTPTKKVCDAAIQTEDPLVGRSEVDGAAPMYTDNLKQHGLRNTVDMGVKSASENEIHGPRAHSAPPPEQLQQMQQQQQQQQQQMPVNGKRQTPPPQAGQSQFGTQTSPHVQTAGAAPGQPPFQKVYYAPQQQTHPQQKQQTPPPPQTPGGTYVRTIPIFVEGRSEPIINSHKEIPNQNAPPSATASASARAYAPPQQQQYYQQPSQQQPQHYPHPQQQQHRPTPLNTQQQPSQQQQTESGAPSGLPPQTPHTLDSINKIQDIQRDVLDLMGKVENFKGTRRDKYYAYLDEMLTRNLLKLDTIDTNGKDSIRLARREAIKCIQASINVLEAKAEENAKTAEGNNAVAAAEESGEDAVAAQKSSSKGEVTKETAAAEATATTTESAEGEAVDATKIQEPIPLPPPEGMHVDEQSNESQKKETSPALATAAGDSTAVESSTSPSPSATAMESK